MTQSEISKSSSKKRNPEAVKADILRVATEEFATSGFAGARVNLIAEKTETSKRMLYYYFGDKERLYIQVLENAYRDIRLGEQELRLASLEPKEALKTLIAFTFDHQRANPAFIKLVMIENIHEGRHLLAKDAFEQVNAPAIQRLTEIYQAGVASGDFRSGLNVVELHWFISSMCFFNNSNRSTFSAAFGTEIFSDAGQERLRTEVEELICRYVSA
ncbi:TetR family transcriptional regulator [Marinobacterium sp. LSUCC0821]|jgi:AcrR family transcriptional regulator|uniref:TetR family transcriptional regulator n=1 Tax=Marinobacterium sp. LSUCC0821 TaxID=2668067 RepID=UPI00145197AB|nr:TetR family transcriptional regulator [Marinobacterium sp. LSUCC0821]QJD72034.1 TetR/AcrR family transcriptional regulator [Marinobacterium sp. LSUCC0821]